MDKELNQTVTETEENEKIMIKGEDGSEKLADVLLYFTLKENGKDYIIYTFNEKDKNGMVVVYSSRVESDPNNPDGFRITGIDTEEEWAKIKDIMRKVIKANGE